MFTLTAQGKGARVDEKNNNGETALSVAAQNGHRDTVELLVVRKVEDKGTSRDMQKCANGTVHLKCAYIFSVFA
jgi:ankyrin repeat protein